jgi:multidrug efflux pump subunit AcrA (membrane-fusion protein)
MLNRTLMKTYQLVLLVIFLILGFACKGPDVEENKTDYPPLAISTEKVSTQDITDSVEIFGTIKIRNEVYLSSQFSGRLKDFSLLQGDRVTEGDQIGIIIPPMREALSQVMRNLSEEQKKLVANEVNEIPLYSPISGTIIEIMQHSGDVIQIGTPVVHIANLSLLDIYGDLPISYLQQLKKVKNIRVNFVDYAHQPMNLAISALDGKVSEQNQTIQVRLALNNTSEEFRPGMMVKMIFPDNVHKNALVVPRSALLEEEGIHSLYVYKDSTVEQRTVQTGIKHEDFVEILSGIEGDEIVATERVYSLTNGMKVSIK